MTTNEEELRRVDRLSAIFEIVGGILFLVAIFGLAFLYVNWW